MLGKTNPILLSMALNYSSFKNDMNQHNRNLSLQDCVLDLTSMMTPWTYSKEMLRNLNCQTLMWSSVTCALSDPLTARSLTRSSWTRHLAPSTTRVRVSLSSACNASLHSNLYFYVFNLRYWHAVPADSDFYGKYGSVFPSQDLNTRCKLPHCVII